MHKRIAKVVTASLMAAAMLTTTVATVVPMSVSAGLCVGETEFNKKGLCSLEVCTIQISAT